MPKKQVINDDVVNDPVEDTVTPKKEENKVDTVTLKKEDYERLISRLEKTSKDIELLYKASDKSRIAKAMGDDGSNLIKQVRIWRWDGGDNYVIATRLKTNRSEIVQGKWIEDQQVDVVLENGDVVESSYLEFSRRTLQKDIAEILSRKEVIENGKNIVYLQVQLPNGKKIEINSAFVN